MTTSPPTTIPSPPPRLPDNPGATAIETVFETLLADIVRGHYPAGARLPAERELARILGASRPTLREALRRLGEWQLVEPRRGSGVVVRPFREWSIEVLPAYLRYGRPGPGQPTIARMLIDLMTLRRSMFRDCVRVVAARMPPGGTQPARSALARAWSVRANPAQFPREDYFVLRAVVESAGFLPAVWMLNRLSGVYLEVALTVSTHFRPPDDYLDAYTRMLDALDRADAEAASSAIGEYLERHDQSLTQALEVFA
jgi:GntR family transcriptional repressor for pyruvate dehydrogenase complex